jgi:hypothetical protein
MRWQGCTGTLVATSIAAMAGTWDAWRWDASWPGALGSGGVVAAMWCVPALVGELALATRTRARPLATARVRVAVVGIATVALALAWVRAPMLARFSDRVLAGWLWAAIALVLAVVGVAVGEPLARRLATRGSLAPRGLVVWGLVLALWIAWALLVSPPVRGLAADLRF